jgi:carotenoid 1,2-hydratase
VFSPYYAWSGRGDPLNHCAINVALYGRPRRWAMTERGRRRVETAADSFTVGPSRVAWDGTALTVEIDEVGVPVPSRLRGTVRLVPEALTADSFVLDAEGRHEWWPIAPRARVEVAMTAPALSWSGTGYLDTNQGSEPLEAGFVDWDWSRAPLPDGGSAVLYNARRRRGGTLDLALAFGRDGTVERFAAPPEAPLPTTPWRVRRATRSEAGAAPRVVETLEDSPFYARSVVETRLCGETVTAVHESLMLDRFATPWCKLMLPFRMPRRR